MIVRQFQTWAETASPPNRADGVSALARAYLYSDLEPDQSRQAVLALTTFLDDPSPIVRRALADAFASAIDAPHPIVLALTEDQPGIAAIVLARSPVLNDAELIDCAASVDSMAQCAIAQRAHVSAPVAAALAEVGSAEALAVLAGNPGADLPGSIIKRMAERHGEDAALREALLARGNLPIDVRADLVAAASRALAAFVMTREWMSKERVMRVSRDATAKAAIAIAADADPETDDLSVLASHLRMTGQISVGFMLRALLSRNRALFVAVLSDLGDVRLERVEGLVKTFENTGFASLYRRASFPLALLPAFRIALAALRDDGGASASGASLCTPLIDRVLTGCAAINDGTFDKVLVLLRRFQTEAARDDARTAKAKHGETQWALAAPVSESVESETPDEMLIEDDVVAAVVFDEAVAIEEKVTQPEAPLFVVDFDVCDADRIAA